MATKTWNQRRGLKLVVTSRCANEDKGVFDETALWERQPGESEVAWRAFVRYRDMPRRSLRDLSRTLAEKQHRNAKTTFRHVAEWSRRWHWSSRCGAWDYELMLVAQQAMGRRHAQTLENSEQVLAQPIAVFAALLRQEPLLAHKLAAQLLDEMRRDPSGALGPYVRLMTLIARCSVAMAQLITAERLACGVSTEYVVGDLDRDTEEPFHCGATQRSMPVSDPALAGLIRAVLLSAHEPAVSTDSQPRRTS